MTNFPKGMESTKEKIQKTTLDIMKSYDSELTVIKICDEAGITRPTFYRYFKDTSELLNHMSEMVLNELKESLIIKKRTPIKEMTYNELPINMVNLFQHIYNNKNFYEIFLLTSKDPYFTSQVLYILEEYIKRGIEYATPKEDVMVPMPLLQDYTVGAYFNSIIWWIENKYPYTPEEMTAILIRLSIKGPYKEDLASFVKE